MEADDREDAPDYYIEEIVRRLCIGEMSPERYVALTAHTWMLAGPLAYRYPDPEVDAHVCRINELMNDHQGLDALRREWLTPEEYARVNSEIEEMCDPDYSY